MGEGGKRESGGRRLEEEWGKEVRGRVGEGG